MKRALISLFLMVIFLGTAYALNDMPLLAQLQGEHNASGFGWDVVSLDFNHDGYNDLIVLALGYGWEYNVSPSRGKVYIYYGGPGFSSASQPAMTLEGDYPEGMRRRIGYISNVGDVNGDGFDDLMIGDAIPMVSTSDRYMIFFGQTADLQIPNMVLCPQPNETFYGFNKLGDVDGDGYDDIGISYAIDMHTLYYDIMWGGTYEHQVILSGVGTLSDKCVITGIGDINADGFDDFSIGYLAEEPDNDYSTIRIYYGNNQRQFVSYTQLVHTPWVITKMCKPLGDMNNDGFADFLGYINANGIKVWLGSDEGLSIEPGVTLLPIYFGDSDLDGIEAGDINGDGFNDVIGASYDQQRFVVWLGSVTPEGFMDWRKTSMYDDFGDDLAMGDFSGDGYADVAASAPWEDPVNPLHDFRGYVFVYAGNPGMVANDDLLAPQLAEQIQMKLSPNPVMGDRKVHISFPGSEAGKGLPLEVEIFNLKGQLVHRTQINETPSKTNSLPIDLSACPSGVYICRAKLGSQTVSKRFTIIK